MDTSVVTTQNLPGKEFLDTFLEPKYFLVLDTKTLTRKVDCKSILRSRRICSRWSDGLAWNKRVYLCTKFKEITKGLRAYIVYDSGSVDHRKPEICFFDVCFGDGDSVEAHAYIPPKEILHKTFELREEQDILRNALFLEYIEVLNRTNRIQQYMGSLGMFSYSG